MTASVMTTRAMTPFRQYTDPNTLATPLRLKVRLSGSLTLVIALALGRCVGLRRAHPNLLPRHPLQLWWHGAQLRPGYVIQLIENGSRKNAAAEDDVSRSIAVRRATALRRAALRCAVLCCAGSWAARTGL